MDELPPQAEASNDSDAIIDRERLERTLGTAPLQPLIDRLTRRFEAGNTAPIGVVSLRAPTAAERAAIDSLLGRPPSTGDPLAIRLDRLDRIVRTAGFAPSLFAAVEALVGPIDDKAARRALDAQAWQRVFDDASSRLQGRSELHGWLEDLQRTGLLKKLVRRDPASGAMLLQQAIDVALLLPHSGTTLNQLAVAATGDAHALDRGSRLMSAVSGALTRLSGIADVRSAGRFLRAWARVGVTCDVLSASVLVLNLVCDADTLTGRLLACCAEAGEPCRLVARQLLHHTPVWSHVTAPETVYVCENPDVITAAAESEKTTMPLVCVEGWPSNAVRLLLERLVAGQVRLCYHGDFDWPGIMIANYVMQEYCAQPWRMSTADYAAAAHGSKLPLDGTPVDARWDAALRPQMEQIGLAVHEEQVLDDLLDDLGP